MSFYVFTKFKGVKYGVDLMDIMGEKLFLCIIYA